MAPAMPLAHTRPRHGTPRLFGDRELAAVLTPVQIMRAH
jgi:hypothetical protein